ncbi:hypothetical protein KCG44_05550 [Pacificimonas sp. WHA3]|uniref:TolA protein n=1 Tax=Pacificimonas pallii TaxID=2827236 RepID=A0ABS6SEG5_9SPHN|nr:hypothetical protein [Pacificimonas pallii]MBV7256247.1 hypothetical protein [Pacificimonas pallii]
MTETRALTMAGIAHLALFATLSLSWSLMADHTITYDEPVPVEFIELGEMPTVTERPEPTLAAAPRETVDAAPAPDTDMLEETPPTEAPDLLVPTETPPPPAKAAPKPEPKKKKPQELTQAVDRNKAEADRALEEQDFASMITDALPPQITLSSIQQSTLVGLIRERIYKCWDPAAGGPDSAAIVTTLRVKAARNGDIIGRPVVVRQSGSANAGYKRAARDAAIRAVMNPSCSLSGLPEKLYAGGWEDFTLNFDPKDL